MLYKVTPIAVVGGSFLPSLAGHNFSEAAAAGCAVLTGRENVSTYLYLSFYEKKIRVYRVSRVALACRSPCWTFLSYAG